MVIKRFAGDSGEKDREVQRSSDQRGVGEGSDGAREKRKLGRGRKNGRVLQRTIFKRRGARIGWTRAGAERQTTQGRLNRKDSCPAEKKV